MAILSTMSTPFPVSDHFLAYHSTVCSKKKKKRKNKGKYNRYILYLTQKCYKIVILSTLTFPLIIVPNITPYQYIDIFFTLF